MILGIIIQIAVLFAPMAAALESGCGQKLESSNVHSTFHWQLQSTDNPHEAIQLALAFVFQSKRNEYHDQSDLVDLWSELSQQIENHFNESIQKQFQFEEFVVFQGVIVKEGLAFSLVITDRGDTFIGRIPVLNGSSNWSQEYWKSLNFLQNPFHRKSIRP